MLLGNPRGEATLIVNMKKIELLPMTRQMCHEFYQNFQNDPAIGHYYEYVYTPEIADRYFDKNSVPDRKLFAILADGVIVGECKLKDIDYDKRECSMGIHLQNDSVKGKGYGTQAERLILKLAFEELGMVAVNADAALKNTRSQHVLEKVGFCYVHEDDAFKYYRCEPTNLIRRAEAESHTQAYVNHELFAPGSWLAKPVKTAIDLLPLFDGYRSFYGLDLGSGVGRNSIALAQYFSEIPCRIDCVDILELAVDKLGENAKKYHVEEQINGIHEAIDTYKISKNTYDLIMAISALEHVGSLEVFEKKLLEIRDGLHDGGVVCLIVNSSVIEYDKDSGEERVPQFEVNLSTNQMNALLMNTFTDWEIVKYTVVHQKYDIPREGYISALETDVVTLVARKGNV